MVPTLTSTARSYLAEYLNDGALIADGRKYAPRGLQNAILDARINQGFEIWRMLGKKQIADVTYGGTADLRPLLDLKAERRNCYRINLAPDPAVARAIMFEKGDRTDLGLHGQFDVVCQLGGVALAPDAAVLVEELLTYVAPHGVVIWQDLADVISPSEVRALFGRRPAGQRLERIPLPGRARRYFAVFRP